MNISGRENGIFTPKKTLKTSFDIENQLFFILIFLFNLEK